MANLKINQINSPLLKRNYYCASCEYDLNFVTIYGPDYLRQLKLNFNNFNVDGFIQNTLEDLITWQRKEDRLNGSIAFSGPLRYAFLAQIFPQIPIELLRRDVVMCLRETPYTLDEFISIPIIKLDDDTYKETIDPLPKSANNFTIIPYIMDTTPEKYSRYFNN